MIRERCPELVALLAVVIAHACCTSLTAGQEPNTASAFDRQALLEMMAEHEIPGLAVAVTHRGKDYDCNLGVADRESSVAVTRETIFEIGSVSKVFTAIAAALADQNGTISLEAPIGRYMDELAGTPLGSVPVYHLATHTAGGFPLQVPERVDSEASLIEYYREWEPQHPPGTRRHYANPSVGLLGLLVARASGTTYAELMESGLFEDLGLGSTYIRVPRNALDKYAWGYNRAGERVRVNPAPLADEAYGVKTTAADLLRVLKLNLSCPEASGPLERAICRTHVGHFDTGDFQQALIWERYEYPLDRDRLRSGNSYEMILRPSEVVEVDARSPDEHAFALSKTGSTAGFGAYVLVLPDEDLAIVLLANKNYPIRARLDAALGIAAELLSP